MNISGSEIISIRLPVTAWNTIGAALSKLPYDTVAQLIEEMNKQIGEVVKGMEPVNPAEE